MLALAFLQWWYGPGWLRGWTSLGARLRRTYYGFSVPQLSRTLLSPWRRIITPGGGSFSDRMRATLDNLVSRIVGLVVRILTIISAGIIAAWWLVIAALQLVVWPLLPLAALGLIVKAVL